MDISNPIYGLVLTTFSLTIAGIAAFFSYRYFTKKGETQERVMGLSVAAGGIVMLIVMMVGIKAPAIVAIPFAVIIIIYALLYARVLTYLRRKIHGHD